MTDSPTTQTAAAGWYPIDGQPGYERYWNGTAWEDATRLVPTIDARPQKSSKKPLIIAAIIGVVVLLFGAILACALVSAMSDTSREERTPSSTESEATDRDSDESEESEDAEDAVEEPAEPAAPAMTLGQEQAVGKGRDYLGYAAFSRKGLIDQLVYEGFNTADATFAVDTLSPDWNAQAAKKAQEYLDYSSFSRQGLIEQLVYEGFTQAQAESGVKAVGY